MRFLILSLCLWFAAFATMADAGGSIIVSPIYSQLVAVPVPADFKAGYENAKDGSYILEMIPTAETVDDWSQMITVTGGQGMATSSSAMDMANRLATGYQAACPASFSAQGLPAPHVKGATEVFSGFLGCGNVGGHSEAMVFLVLKGSAEIYTVQWAERGPVAAKPVPPDPARWRPRADALGLTRICDKVTGEAAPYPSCTQ